MFAIRAVLPLILTVLAVNELDPPLPERVFSCDDGNTVDCCRQQVQLTRVNTLMHPIAERHPFRSALVTPGGLSTRPHKQLLQFFCYGKFKFPDSRERSEPTPAWVTRVTGADLFRAARTPHDLEIVYGPYTLGCSNTHIPKIKYQNTFEGMYRDTWGYCEEGPYIPPQDRQLIRASSADAEGSDRKQTGKMKLLMWMKRKESD